jgi:hypothetical protein
MDVFNYANNIYLSQICNNHKLYDHHNIISASAILHDMCDKKYVVEENQILNIKKLLSNHLNEEENNKVAEIISSISYSKVKKFGYPNLVEYTDAYHIVREADLLAGYDINRCIIYGMIKENNSYVDAVKRAIELYNTRMGKYIEDDLFISDYSKKKAVELDLIAKENINMLRKLIL